MDNYEHGGNIYKKAKLLGIEPTELIDFSANINPLGVPASLKKAIYNSLDTIVNYPDPKYTTLVEAISRHEKVDCENIIVGNGATEIIYEIIRAIKPPKSLVAIPTFLEYERVLSQINSDIEYFYLKEENSFRIDENFLKAIDNSIEMIILCNPNNPTGQLIDREVLIRILETCRENSISLMIDESFMEFVDETETVTLMDYINSYKHLYIIKSLTKFFAIPGLRLGYGISSNDGVLKRTIDSRPPWTINSLASLAGEVILRDRDYIEQSKAWIKNEREFLYRGLQELPRIKIYPPKGNYIMFQILMNNRIDDILAQRRLLIRGCGNYRNLSEKYYRVAVKDRDSNLKLLKGLKEVLNED